MTRTVCIIQARLASTRLPAKVLLPLPTGRTVLEEVVWRCEQIEGVNQVVVALPYSAKNDILLRYCGGADAHKSCAPEQDLLWRYSDVSRAASADLILRVTSDCPLIDPDECTRILAVCDQGARYARLSAGGWSCEAFTSEALETAAKHADDAYDREHVGPWMARNIEPRVMADGDGPPSLDTLDDYIRIWKIFEDQIAADPSLRAA